MKAIPTLSGDESIKELRQIQDRDEVTGGHQRNPTALRHILAPTDLTLDAQRQSTMRSIWRRVLERD